MDYKIRKKTYRGFYLAFLAVALLMLFALVGVGSSLAFPQDGDPSDDDADDDTEDDVMPDYAANVIMEPIYIVLTQETSHTLLVEELIWFNNTGNRSFNGKLFIWSQPGSILNQIFQFGLVYGEDYQPMKAYPSGNFLYADLGEANKSIPPGDSIEFVFKYEVKYPADWSTFYFNNTFLYDTTDLVVMVNGYDGYTITGESGLDLNYDEKSGIYITPHGGAKQFDLSSTMAVKFSDTSNPAGDDDDDDASSSDSFLTKTNIGYIILGVVVILIFAVVVVLIYKRMFPEEDEDEVPPRRSSGKSNSKKGSGKNRPGRNATASKSSSGKKRSSGKTNRAKSADSSSKSSKAKGPRNDPVSLNEEKKNILKTTERLKKDYKDGTITKDLYDELRLGCKNDLKAINKKIENLKKIDATPRMLELENKKEGILSAIRKLEEDHDAGTIDDDLFKEMNGVYKKKAIEVLKDIDKERQS